MESMIAAITAPAARRRFIDRAIIGAVRRKHPEITEDQIAAAIAGIESDTGKPILDLLKGIDWAKLIELILEIIKVL